LAKIWHNALNMTRTNTKIGDIFSAQTGQNSKKYFQYVANDLTQLNSDVIRAFKTEYPLDAMPNLKDVIKDEVAFYAHCATKWGIKMGLWEKVGNSLDVGMVDVWFRGTNDDGKRINGELIKASYNWYVWKINNEFQRVGELKGEHRQAEIEV
jgi:hypothetical protein